MSTSPTQTEFDEDGLDLPVGLREDLARLAPYRPGHPAAPTGLHTTGRTTRIIGNDGMHDLVRGLTELVRANGVGQEFEIIAEGSSTGMPALLTGATLLAPLSRMPWPEDLAAFRAVHGADPVMIRIGHSGHGPRRTGKTPPALYVHRDNPLRSMTLDQLRAVAARDHAVGTVRRWSQLGVSEHPWSVRRIHLYGLPATGGFAGSFAERVLDGHQYVEAYEEVADRRELANAIEQDRYGLGISGWSPAWRFTDAIRPLALADGSAAPALPTLREVYADRYPLTAPLLLCLAPDAQGRIEPLALELCRAALSREGQELVAAQAATEEGYVPLSPALVDQQRARLDALLR